VSCIWLATKLNDNNISGVPPATESGGNEKDEVAQSTSRIGLGNIERLFKVKQLSSEMNKVAKS
jgi:hypothetical protein